MDKQRRSDPLVSGKILRLTLIVGALGLLPLFVFSPPARATAGGTTITGFVYYDLNRNGRWDSAESPATEGTVGWTWPARGGVKQVTTDGTGHYAFTLTPPDPQSSYGYLWAEIGNAVGSTVAYWPVSFNPNPIHLDTSPPTMTMNLGVQFTGPPQLCRGCSNLTGFSVDPRFWSYYMYRGGIQTFGYPVSRLFLFEGFSVQIFQRAILQLFPDNTVRLLNLFDPGLLDFASFNGAVVPAYDPTLVAQAPPTDAPNYAQSVIAFVARNAPDTFSGQPVGFGRTFFATVPRSVSLPAATSPVFPYPTGTVIPVIPPTATPNQSVDPSLLPGFDLEIWGIPTSRPSVDPSNHTFVYQRFQRGIMHYQAELGVTEGMLLGNYLKNILTGHNLPIDLAQEAAGGAFLRQYCPANSRWICRPTALNPSANDLTGAFEPEPPP
jgi:hypothetical protein